MSISRPKPLRGNHEIQNPRDWNNKILLVALFCLPELSVILKFRKNRINNNFHLVPYYMLVSHFRTLNTSSVRLQLFVMWLPHPLIKLNVTFQGHILGITRRRDLKSIFTYSMGKSTSQLRLFIPKKLSDFPLILNALSLTTQLCSKVDSPIA